jgi:hypothetical protein
MILLLLLRMILIYSGFVYISVVWVERINNLKLYWELLQSNLQWAQFLTSRVIHGSKPISYHVYSSIWSIIKHKFVEVSEQATWQLGTGENIRFWLDSWCGVPLVSLFRHSCSFTPFATVNSRQLHCELQVVHSFVSSQCLPSVTIFVGQGYYSFSS